MGQQAGDTARGHDRRGIGVNPGQAIRFPVEEKGRFEGLSVDKWKGKYTVTPIDFGGGVPGMELH